MSTRNREKQYSPLNIEKNDSSIIELESLANEIKDESSKRSPKISMSSEIFTSKGLSLNEVIEKSTLASNSSSEQLNNIIEAFNRGIDKDEIITTDAVRGKRIPPGQFKIFTLNNIAMIVGPTEENIARVLHPFTTSEVKSHGHFDQLQQVISVVNKHIVNVPKGHLAKIMLGNEPKLLAEGPHYFCNGQFRFEGIVPMNNPYINHRTIHVVKILN